MINNYQSSIDYFYKLRRKAGIELNILHLKYAVEVAKTRSISKAAENLYMGQPNLSRAIKELEDPCGITIFRRTTKGISITPDGEEFLQYARQIVQKVDEVEQIYHNGRQKKQSFSVSVPRASYLSYAMADFSRCIKSGSPAEFYYCETNSMNTINSVVGGFQPRDRALPGVVRKVLQRPFQGQKSSQARPLRSSPMFCLYQRTTR